MVNSKERRERGWMETPKWVDHYDKPLSMPKAVPKPSSVKKPRGRKPKDYLDSGEDK